MIATVALAATLLAAAPPSTAPPGGYTAPEAGFECTGASVVGWAHVPGTDYLTESYHLRYEATFLLDGAIVATASDEFGAFPMMENTFFVLAPAGTVFDDCTVEQSTSGPLTFSPMQRDTALTALACADELRSDSTTMLRDGGQLLTDQPASACDTLDNMLTLEGNSAATDVGKLLDHVQTSIAVRSINTTFAGDVELDAAQAAEARGSPSSCSTR
jgi:hypothetical protein